MNIKEFYNDFKDGQKIFGEDIAVIINSALLSLVYIIGVGATFFIAKFTKKTFLDVKIDESVESYWVDLNLGKKKMEEYYRQF